MAEKLYLPELPSSPMFEGSKDVMTVEWQEFFRGLFDRTGGIETDSLDDTISDLIAGTYSIPVDYGKRIDDLEIRLNSLPTPKSYDKIIDDLERTIIAIPDPSLTQNNDEIEFFISAVQAGDT
jgi:hypothetical protein